MPKIYIFGNDLSVFGFIFEVGGAFFQQIAGVGLNKFLA